MAENYEIVEPNPASLIEALRAVGYTVQTAVADLIDNSITAGAQHVWLRFEWMGKDSYVSITDDGAGMSEKELSDAMRPGSRSPLEQRSPDDLGRFGLGLKTASFSQARRLTVASRRGKGGISLRRWDLDYVERTGQWRLLKSAEEGSAPRLGHLSELDHGTVVLWECLDRIVGEFDQGNTAAQSRFLATVQGISQHLAMVFHQYIGGSRPRLKIYINGLAEKNRVRPWDPFLEQHIATYSPSDAEAIHFPAGTIRAKGFVLPHKDRLSESEFKEAAGPGGWIAQQGFYVYRNQRLLVSGGWLDLGYTCEEQYKLARIRVEIPNSTDAEWSIDVKKSRARPPPALRARLLELANLVRGRAREVFAHRGRKAAGPTGEPLQRTWTEVARDGKLAYKIDRTHSLVRLVLDNADKRQRSSIEALLKLLEATVPVQKIWLDVAERPTVPAAPFQLEPPKHVQEVISQLYRALRADGISADVARRRLTSIEPFNLYPEHIELLSEREN